MAKIDWDQMTGGSFLKIEAGKPVELVLKNWKVQDKFKDEKTGMIKPGVSFEVWQENKTVFNEKTKLDWTVTAIGLLKLLKPICMKAEAANKSEIKVSVVAVGDGPKRVYSVTEVA